MAGQKRLFCAFGGGDDMTPLRAKKGTTVSYAGFAELTNGDDWIATSKLKEPTGSIVGSFGVELIKLPTRNSQGYTHVLTIFANGAETARWPATRLHCDIAFSSPAQGLEFSSSTFFVQVEEGVSR